jgi:hypothetical protein
MMNQTAILSGAEAALLASISNANSLQAEKKLYSYYEFDFSSLTDGLYVVDTIVFEHFTYACPNSVSCWFLKPTFDWENDLAVNIVTILFDLFEIAFVSGGWRKVGNRNHFGLSFLQGLYAGNIESIKVKKVLGDNSYGSIVTLTSTITSIDNISFYNYSESLALTSKSAIIGININTTYTKIYINSTPYNLNGSITIEPSGYGAAVDFIIQLKSKNLSWLQARAAEGIYFGVKQGSMEELIVFYPIADTMGFALEDSNSNRVSLVDGNGENVFVYLAEGVMFYNALYTQINVADTNDFLGFGNPIAVENDFTTPININPSGTPTWYDDFVNKITADTSFIQSLPDVGFEIASAYPLTGIQGSVIVSYRNQFVSGGQLGDIVTDGIDNGIFICYDSIALPAINYLPIANH